MKTNMQVVYALTSIIFLWLANVTLCLADESVIQIGEKLYQQNCMICHQADAIGKPGMAPSLTNKELLANASDKFFLKTIRDGRPGTGMPPFVHLDPDSVKAIIAYLNRWTFHRPV